jgi:hypothetical protein
MTHHALRKLLYPALAGITLLLTSYGGMIGTATRAEAGICYDLWYQRNAIFAQRGYCFKACGMRVWGRNCFGPYFGKLTQGQWAAVRSIQAQERAIGCPPCPQAWQ